MNESKETVSSRQSRADAQRNSQNLLGFKPDNTPAWRRGGGNGVHPCLRYLQFIRGKGKMCFPQQSITDCINHILRQPYNPMFFFGIFCLNVYLFVLIFAFVGEREHEVGLVGRWVGCGRSWERRINMIKIHCMESLGTQKAHRPGKQMD